MAWVPDSGTEVTEMAASVDEMAASVTEMTASVDEMAASVGIGPHATNSRVVRGDDPVP